MSGTTAAADTLVQITPAPPVPVSNPFRELTDGLCREADAPSAATETAGMNLGVVPYTVGMAPTPRKLLPGYDTGILCLLIGLFIIISANFRHYSSFLKNFTGFLFTTRRRGNVFDDHTTNESLVLLSFILLLCLSAGILIFSAASHFGIEGSAFRMVVTATCGVGVFYILQLIVLGLIGYVFARPGDSVQWIKSYQASECLLGLALAAPALLVLFNPGWCVAMVLTACIFYLLSRIIFIIKGFKIFYTNSFSLIYIILYICSVEIAPLIVLYKLTVRFSQSAY